MPDRRLLVVDDDEDLRESLISVLRDEGYQAQGARNGLAALTLMSWQKFVPHAILLDLLMPSMNGTQLREALHKRPEWKAIPIVIFSGGPVPEGLTGSVFAVLEKPFDLDHMLAVVEAACACGERSPP